MKSSACTIKRCVTHVNDTSDVFSAELFKHVSHTPEDIIGLCLCVHDSPHLKPLACNELRLLPWVVFIHGAIIPSNPIPYSSLCATFRAYP